MTACRWYVLCENEAVGTAWHAVLGNVPCCMRCAAKHNLDLVMFPVQPANEGEDEVSSWHIVPVCFRIRGGNDLTRLQAAEFVRDTLASFQEAYAERFDIDLSDINHVTGGRVDEWWLPNDPEANYSGEARDKFHLEWAEGPIPHDMGDNVILKEE